MRVRDASTPRKTLLPADWGPDPSWLDRQGVARDERPGLIDRFRDLAAAKAWVYADWQAAFRNFTKNEVTYGRLTLYPPALPAPKRDPEPPSGERMKITPADVAELVKGLVSTGVTRAS